MSAGKNFRELLQIEKPLQLAGAINAYCALLAKEAGFRALYLSGSGVAGASYGLPDLGITTLSDVLEDASRIAAITELPLLVDADTGWGNARVVHEAVNKFINIGVAGIHIEDQVDIKRCGHLDNKELVSAEAMCDRIKSAVDARSDDDFVIMARTDAFSVEGFDAAVDRALAYKEAGADMIFPEAMTNIAHYADFRKKIGLPILANITEFGRTPLFTASELRQANVDMALYPLSAFRVMSAAALKAYQKIRQEGTQASLVDHMQTREEFYRIIKYKNFEKKLKKSIKREDK